MEIVTLNGLSLSNKFGPRHSDTYTLTSTFPSLMKNRSTPVAIAAALALGISGTALAQDEAVNYTPKDMVEFGLAGGYAFVEGDYNNSPGYYGGLHVRKAFDHIFSARVDLHYLVLNSDAPDSSYPYEKSDFTSVGGSVQAIVTLNNIRFDKPMRKVNIYAFAGPGVGAVQLAGTPPAGTQPPAAEVNLVELNDLNRAVFWADAGAGMAFRVSPRFNIGLEYKFMVPFGKYGDLLDAYNNPGQPTTTFRDIANVPNLRFNFNLGNTETLTEPLYWVNPLNQVIDELTELKARPELDLTDTDGDGVIDMLDQDNETPEGAPVDTRGIALDSDGDGVPDYEDAEPYSPPGMTVDARGVAQVPKYLTRPEIQSLIDDAIGRIDLTGGGSLDDWFLPMIHFADDSYTIRAADYGHLKNVAQVMRSNPDVRVVVQGFTDKRASDDYNRVLSYNRARSAKEYLVNRYGVSPDRLIIQYDGEANVLVPTNGSSFMNRRVEFRVAKAEDSEMGQPEGRAGRGTFFSGSRDAGY